MPRGNVNLLTGALEQLGLIRADAITMNGMGELS